MGLLRATISLKNLVQLSLAAYCGLVLLLFIQYEAFDERIGGLVSFQGVLLTIESVLICAFLVGRSDRRQFGLIAFLLLMVGIYYWIPVINLIVFPENFLRGYPLSNRVNRDDVDIALAFLAIAIPLSIVALMASRHTRAVGAIQLFRSSEVAMRTYWGALALILGSSAIELYRYLVIGQGRFGVNASGAGNWMFYLITDFQLVCIIFLGAGISAWPLLGRRGRQLFVIGLIIYMVTRMLSGSKGGVFDVAVFAVGAVLLFSDLNRVKVKLLVILTAGAVVLFPLSFMAGFVTRAVTFSSDLRSNAIGVQDIYNQGFESYGDKEEIFSPVNIVKRMAARVNAFDVLVIIVRSGSEVKQDFWDTTPKAIVNLIMPGEPFENILPSSRLFLVEYGEQLLEEALRIYHTDVWYIYGVFVPFVGVIGALILVFFSLNFFATLYYHSFRLHDRWRFYSLIFVVYCFYWFIVNLGIDEWIGIVVKAGVNMLFFVAAVYFFGQWTPRRLATISPNKASQADLENALR